MTGFVRCGGVSLAVVVAAVLAACSSTPLSRPPVEDRSSSQSKPALTAPSSVATAPAVKPLPGAENAGKAGYYTVKPGDTLIRIGLEAGQSYKDIARWSELENPNRIEVGQVLRITPPTESVVATAKPVSSSTVTSAPLGSASSAGKPVAAAIPAGAASAPAASPTAVPVASVSSSGGDDDLGWIWPANGPTITSFDETKNKGMDIAGSAGDAVVAAADGRVVFAGAAVRGYGNLIILKHNNTYLTAYGHNQTLLVKEDQIVRKGQKIAEMGSTDTDRVKLHFEVRRQGKPMDPAKYLPPR